MRPAGLFAFPAWFLYLVWRRVGWRPLVVGVLAFAIPLLAYAGAHKQATGQFALIESNGWFLYGRVGEIAAPCGGAKIPPATRVLCERRANKEEGHAFLYLAKRITGPQALRRCLGRIPPGAAPGEPAPAGVRSRDRT